ncbi:MAG TPA: UDP-N-acetylglucosamine 1-carboxyvinyltransferase [bacterium]
MDKILVEGGVKISGEIAVGGAKNAVLPLMAASILLTRGSLKIHNVPMLQDVKTMINILRLLGADISINVATLEIDTSSIKKVDPDPEGVKAMRASVVLMGPMLGKFGRVSLPLPGGCAIGERPIDQHLAVFEAMGADVSINNGFVNLIADSLKGTDFRFKVSTVTGTENAIMSAVMAKGKTVLYNCAMEPEVVALADALNSMGGRISGAGTETIVINGGYSLHGIEHEVMPDRIEAATFLIAGAVAGSNVFVKTAGVRHLNAVIGKLKEAGVSIEERDSGILVHGCRNPAPTNVKTMVYPGFPTDVQAQFMVLMCLADGESLIEEAVFENRFHHVRELQKMGADITLDGRYVRVRGVNNLKGARVIASDLRASASLVIAGLAAEGFTEIEGVEHLDRGYEKIENKMSGVGARIKRIVV